MNFTEAQVLNTIAMMMWPFMRISAMFVSMPVLSVRAMPARIRVIISGAITLLVMPMLPPVPQTASNFSLPKKTKSGRHSLEPLRHSRRSTPPTSA